MSSVFPPRNLPSRAEQWGRAVEGEIRAIERDLVQDEQSEQNWSRSASGRLAVLARNLQEVSDRSADVIQLGNLSVSGSATSEPFPRTNTTVDFPSVPKNRTALLTLTGNVSESTGTGARLYIYLIYQGEIVGVDQIQPFSPLSTPSEWLNNAPTLITSPIRIPGGAQPSITVRLVRGSDPTTPGSSTMTLQSPVLTLTRSGPR